VDAARVMAILIARTSPRESAMARDGAALRVMDVGAQAALVERETLERVSRAQAENTAA
jgi:hypothetical protein